MLVEDFWCEATGRGSGGWSKGFFSTQLELPANKTAVLLLGSSYRDGLNYVGIFLAMPLDGLALGTILGWRRSPKMRAERTNPTLYGIKAKV